MESLEEYRREIDSIDKELVSLFEKRMNLAIKIGEYKKKKNILILNTQREDEVIKKNIDFLKNKNYSEITKKFFENIMEISRSLQEDFVKVNKN